MSTSEQQRNSHRAARIEARITSEQKRLFERAAEIEGVTLTDFAVSSMHRAAVQVFENHAMITLSNRDQQAFVAALMKPPEPNAALKSAAKRYLGQKR